MRTEVGGGEESVETMVGGRSAEEAMGWLWRWASHSRMLRSVIVV
jgi:hypothetical protein